MKIFHVPRSRSVRPIWLCYELGLEPDIVTVTSEFKLTQQWRDISPAGKVPALVDGDIRITESGAIVEFILERYGHGHLQPKAGTLASAEYRQWCWFAEATLIRPLGIYRTLRANEENASELVSEAKDKFKQALAMVEQGLTGKTFLLGDDFSAADIMMGYSIAMIEPLLRDQYPACSGYLQRLQSRQAFRLVLALDA